MVDIVNHIVTGLESLKGKEIEVSSQDSIIRGLFLSYRHKEYFYELILKTGRYKKRITIFYPFSLIIENGILHFDYRLHKLSHRCPIEHVYNVLRQKNNAHPFLNSIVKIYEVRPDSELSKQMDS